MTPVEIIALIFMIIAAIKILVILIKPKAWTGVVNKVYAQPAVTMIISLILAGIVLYYLDKAGITIVQIFAVTGFLAMLGAIGVSAYSKDVKALANKLLKDRNMVKKCALQLIIWIALLVWGFYALFA